MNIDTTSLCPTCYRTVPARIYHDPQVMLKKNCHDHGECIAVVEPDPEFYRLLQQYPRVSLYNHLILDVTSRCPLSCPHCYYPVNNRAPDPTIDQLVKDAACVNLDLILGGAEPTTRKDLPELIKEFRALNRSVSVITNGLRLTDPKYVATLANAGLVRVENAVLETAISLHTPAYNGASIYETKLRALETITSLGLRIGEIMFTVTSAAEAVSLLPVIRQWQPHVNRFRIRGPHKTWNTHECEPPVFASDFYNTFRTQSNTDGCVFRILDGWDNNLYHTVIQYDQAVIRLIACPSAENVLLPELLGYGPFYRAQTGELTNFIHALLINQGLQKGYMHGIPIWEEGEYPETTPDE